MKAIVCEHLRKRYGALVAVNDVSFEVECGEIFVLLGPNGAGKTTTVEIVEGLRRPDEGRATVLGQPAGARSLAPRIGVMPQEADLYQGIRTIEALRLFASFYERPEDPVRLLERLDLARVARTTYRRLSGGEKRRLSLALAVVGRPEVAFLDEPTSGMDVEGRARTWEMIRHMREEGTTVLVTTHLLDEAERVADRVAILRRGELVASGSVPELVGRGGGEVKFATTAPFDRDAVAAAVGTAVVADSGGYRLPSAPATPELVAALARALADQHVLLCRLDTGPRSLEEFYLEVTK